MSPCIGCQAGCCRSFAVPVTGADLAIIEARLGLDFAQVACRWEDKDGLIASGTAPHFFFADEPGTPFVICLRHEASDRFPESSRCRFLVEDDPGQAASYCGIYESRPLSCRVFPTRLHRSGSLVELHAVPKHGRPEDPNPAYQLCSRPWTRSDVDPILSLQNLVLIQFEMQFFQRVADVWNRAAAEFELFPDFLKEVYSSRVLEAPDGRTAEIPEKVQKSLLGRNIRAA